MNESFSKQKKHRLQTEAQAKELVGSGKQARRVTCARLSQQSGRLEAEEHIPPRVVLSLQLLEHALVVGADLVHGVAVRAAATKQRLTGTKRQPNSKHKLG